LNNYALLAFSRKGQFAEKICSYDIASREHARKFWPLVTIEAPHQLVTYVSPSFDKKTKELIRRSCFRRLPKGHRKSVARKLREDAEECHRLTSESASHKKAKELLGAALKSALEAGRSIEWCFADKSRSDFSVRGNLLLGAEEVVLEHPFHTPFDDKFRLDIGILGPKVGSGRLLLGGIEIELSHAFDGYKGLVSKTLGFPMISVDISEMKIEEITSEWAEGIIQATTLTTEDGRRKTYIYLHDLVYPQFMDYPAVLRLDDKHHYLVFAPDKDVSRLDSTIKSMSRELGYGQHGVVIHRMNRKSPQSEKELVNLGIVVGDDWVKVNANQCLRIAVPRPTGVDDLKGHRFHTALARILLSEPDALLGYKYVSGIRNDDPKEDLWLHSQYMGRDQDPIIHRMLPKRLAEPISQIMALVNTLQAQSEQGHPDDESMTAEEV